MIISHDPQSQHGICACRRRRCGCMWVSFQISYALTRQTRRHDLNRLLSLFLSLHHRPLGPVTRPLTRPLVFKVVWFQLFCVNWSLYQFRLPAGRVSAAEKKRVTADSLALRFLTPPNPCLPPSTNSGLGSPIVNHPPIILLRWLLSGHPPLSRLLS